VGLAPKTEGGGGAGSRFLYIFGLILNQGKTGIIEPDKVSDVAEKDSRDGLGQVIASCLVSLDLLFSDYVLFVAKVQGGNKELLVSNGTMHYGQGNGFFCSISLD
jgi:hypothetical protein